MTNIFNTQIFTIYSPVASAEEQLKNYGNFLEGHDKKLKGLISKNKDTQQEKPLLRQPLVQVNYAINREELSLVKLLESERLLNKILLTVGHLCAEINDINQEAEAMQIKFLYKDEELLQNSVSGSGGGDEDDWDVSKQSNAMNNNALLPMSESMEFLCKINFLLQRCILLCNNLLHQCGAILDNEDKVQSVELKLTVMS